MLRPAVAPLLLAAVMNAGPQQKAPDPAAPAAAIFPCDADGAIRCSYDQVEVVTGSRSLDDMRIIGKFIQLITDKTRGRQLPIPYTEVFSQADFMQ